MAQSSFPFENVDVSETDFGKWASALAGGYGVTPYGDTLAVSGDNSGMQVRVASGRAVLRGHLYENSAQATVALAAAHATYARYDAIVLRLDLAANSITLQVLAGTPASSPTYPSPTQTDAGIFECLLGYVYVAAGATSITAGNVTDARAWFRNSQPDNSRFLLMGA